MYDGDEMNGFLLLETDAVEKFMIMHPAHNYMSRNRLEVTSMLSIPKTSLLIGNTFLNQV